MMNHIKIFEDFNVDESETSSYEPPKFIVKPYPGDKGFELVRKRYHRFIWVAPGLGKKGKIDQGENPPVTESAGLPFSNADFIDRDTFNPAEISGMGRSMDFPGNKTAGYKRDTGALPSVEFEDPDEKKSKKRKLKKIKRFADFIKGDEPEK